MDRRLVGKVGVELAVPDDIDPTIFAMAFLAIDGVRLSKIRYPAPPAPRPVKSTPTNYWSLVGHHTWVTPTSAHTWVDLRFTRPQWPAVRKLANQLGTPVRRRWRTR
jgi:hypothetical protein